MSFPTTPILDNFNRPDCGPPLSANWTDDAMNSGSLGLEVVSNQCKSTVNGNLANAMWNITPFGPRCEVYARVTVLPDIGQSCGVFLRLTNPTTPDVAGYYLEWGNYIAGATLTIYRLDPGGMPVILIEVPCSINAGDCIGLRADGDVLTAYRTVNGAWQVVYSTIDATYTTRGYIGIMLQSEVALGRMDNFGGGEYSLLLTCNHYCELSDVEGLLKRDFSETDPDLTEALIESYICMRAGEIDAARQAGAQTGALSAGGAQYLRYLNMIGAASLVDLSCRGGMSNAAEFPTRAWWVEEFRQGLEKIRLSQIIVTQSGTGADYPACGTAERGWTPFADLRIMRNRGG